jgi:hypothetical protein
MVHPNEKKLTTYGIPLSRIRIAKMKALAPPVVNVGLILFVVNSAHGPGCIEAPSRSA